MISNNSKQIFACLSLTHALLLACTAVAEPPSVEVYASAGLTDGAASKGETVFRSEASTCTKCHAVGGKQRGAGPDLYGIGDKYSREQLVQAVLYPNASLLPDYATTIVLKSDGTTEQGVLRKRTADAIQLQTAEGKLIEIPDSEVEETKKGDKSLMPEDLHKQLTVEQFRDLIEYLGTLKLPKLDSKTGLAIADDIPQLTEPIKLVPFVSESMDFDLPVWFSQVPGTENQFFVIEQRTDRIWRLVKSPNGDRKSLFLDLSYEVSEGQFEGLVCLATHPNFQKNGLYYLNHNTRGPKNEFGTVIVERQADVKLMRDTGRATRQLLEIPQNTDVHPGGMIGFGPDNYLYVSTGDGGPQKDPEGRAQNLSILSGSLLRIDVDGRSPGLEYAIPSDNPYANAKDSSIRREVWAHGFRNLWRFSWDPLTKDMWIGDVGQNSYEEITIAQKGENHGWNIYEGFSEHSKQYRRDGTTYISPVFAYPRNLGVSVTGGYVYRGKRSPSFYGVYIFADYESKRIWGLTQSKRKLLKIREIGRSEQRIASFGEDHAGELYAVGYEGMIYRIDLDEAVFE